MIRGPDGARRAANAGTHTQRQHYDHNELQLPYQCTGIRPRETGCKAAAEKAWTSPSSRWPWPGTGLDLSFAARAWLWHSCRDVRSAEGGSTMRHGTGERAGDLHVRRRAEAAQLAKADPPGPHGNRGRGGDQEQRPAGQPAPAAHGDLRRHSGQCRAAPPCRLIWRSRARGTASHRTTPPCPALLADNVPNRAGAPHARLAVHRSLSVSAATVAPDRHAGRPWMATLHSRASGR
jgi:hypothetical protein